MSETEDFENATEAYRPASPMRAAKHKFLFLGIILAVAIAGALAWMNEAAKVENKFQRDIDIAERSGIPPDSPSGGLAYKETPPAKPAEVSLPGTTTQAPPAE